VESWPGAEGIAGSILLQELATRTSCAIFEYARRPSADQIDIG
jgi:hypothetical protein